MRLPGCIPPIHPRGLLTMRGGQKAIIAAMATFIACYLMVSFVTFDFDVRNWGAGGRALFLVFAVYFAWGAACLPDWERR